KVPRPMTIASTEAMNSSYPWGSHCSGSQSSPPSSRAMNPSRLVAIKTEALMSGGILSVVFANPRDAPALHDAPRDEDRGVVGKRASGGGLAERLENGGWSVGRPPLRRDP